MIDSRKIKIAVMQTFKFYWSSNWILTFYIIHKNLFSLKMHYRYSLWVTVRKSSFKLNILQIRFELCYWLFGTEKDKRAMPSINFINLGLFFFPFLAQEWQSVKLLLLLIKAIKIWRQKIFVLYFLIDFLEIFVRLCPMYIQWPVWVVNGQSMVSQWSVKQVSAHQLQAYHALF